jgi:hypothetical protein
MVISVHVAVVLVVVLGQKPQLLSEVMMYLSEGQLSNKGLHLKVMCVGAISLRNIPFGGENDSACMHASWYLSQQCAY